MNEASLTQKLLDGALKRAASKKIVIVNLQIGPFSEEREENIRCYWRDLAKGTSGEGANVHFRHLEPRLTCLGCGGVFRLEGEPSLCRYCQRDRLQLPDDDEVQLESIEVE
jgi:Zn finger protein HypA/HybF involved in hydrogenase expression